MSKFTKGPWKTDSQECLVFIPVRDSVGRQYAVGCATDELKPATGFYSSFVEENEGEAHANMRLISAAPEMYVALKEAVELGKQYIEEIGPCDHSVNICACGVISWVERWSEILQKAEGKQ